MADGNTLDAPTEGAWAPRAQEVFFEQFAEKGFTNVRIPVQWNHHTATTPPYAIDSSFLNRVTEVVGWSIAQGLITVLNTHHEDWMDNATTFEQELPRLKAIWEQIATHFQQYNTSLLVFEVFKLPLDSPPALSNSMRL